MRKKKSPAPIPSRPGNGSCVATGPDRGRCIGEKEILRMIRQVYAYENRPVWKRPVSETDAIRELNERVAELPVYKETMAFLKRNTTDLVSGYSIENQVAADYWYRFIPGVRLDTPELVNVKPLVPASWIYRSRGKTRFTAAWLSNYDIDMVLAPYTQFYTNVVYFPAAGCDFMDFDKYEDSRPIREYSARAMEKHGKDAIAMPLISFAHDMPQAAAPVRHWFAVYVQYRHRAREVEVALFDSQVLPDLPFHENTRRTLARTLLADDMVEGYRVSWTENKKVHQKKDGECGMYVIDYLVSRMVGKSSRGYDAAQKPDQKMSDLRRAYFYFPEDK